MSTPRILIVDDDDALLQALPQMLYLRMRDIQVDTSDSTEKALAQLEEHEYDVIASDIKMPGTDGLSLLTQVRERHSETPVLLITGHGEHDLAIQALRGGAYDYILKPIDRDAFIVAIQRAIQTYRLRKQVSEQHLALSHHAKTLEWLVQKRTGELVAANATKDKFLSIVAHELRAPLANLKGLTQLLLNQVTDEVPLEVLTQGLNDMYRSLERTETLVQDLLDISLMDSNLFMLHRTRCDLVALCRSLLDEYTSGAGPLLTCELMGEALETEIDENRIRQVLLNLLSNARKYSAQGSPITVTVQQSGYEAIVSIRDMGIGIPADALPHIFEQFYRVPGVKVLNGPRSGLGLGLYISRKIVERHGGRIDVQSIPNQGSTFSVRLPIFVDPDRSRINANLLKPHMQAIWTLVH
jgi:signal transduction histidine kinase